MTLHSQLEKPKSTFGVMPGGQLVGTISLSVFTSAWEWLTQSSKSQDIGCYQNRDSWKIQAASRQVDLKYTELTTNAVMGQTAFVLTTGQDLN